MKINLLRLNSPAVEAAGERERCAGEGERRAAPESGHTAAQRRQAGEGGTRVVRPGSGEPQDEQDGRGSSE